MIVVVVGGGAVVVVDVAGGGGEEEEEMVVVVAMVEGDVSAGVAEVEEAEGTVVEVGEAILEEVVLVMLPEVAAVGDVVVLMEDVVLMVGVGGGELVVAATIEML